MKRRNATTPRIANKTKDISLPHLASIRGGQKRSYLAPGVYIEETSLVLNLSIGWDG